MARDPMEKPDGSSAAQPGNHKELMARFASLGQNCELGFVQRAVGAEPLDIFRWASTPLPILLNLLNNRFEGIGDPALLQVREDAGGEYMVDHLGYEFTWHSFVKTAAASIEAVRRREVARLPRMAEIMIDHLTAGERILVVKRDTPLSEQDVAPLLRAVRQYGDCPLLFVTLAAAEAPAGSVDSLGDGLYRGHLRRFADHLHVPETTDVPQWLELCDAAAALVDHCRAGDDTKVPRSSEEPPSSVGDRLILSTGPGAGPRIVQRDRRRFIAFVGNCQMQVLKQVYDQYVGKWTGEQTAFISAHEPISEADRALVMSVDVVVGQVADWKSHIDLNQLPSGVARHFLPVISGGFLWPYSGQGRPDNPTPAYPPGGPYPRELGDSHLNRMIERGASPEQAVDDYLALDLGKRLALDRLVDLALEGQRNRDRQTDYTFADEILRRFRDEQTFLTFGHPALPIARRFATQFFENMNVGQEALERLDQGLVRNPFPPMELPVHPSVIRHFGLRYVDLDYRYRHILGERLTIREYYLKYMRNEFNGELAEGLRLKHEKRSTAALERLQASIAGSPRAAEGWLAIGDLLLEQGRLSDAHDALQRAAVLDPTEPHAHGQLGAVYLRRGDPVEADRELSAAVRLEPSNARFLTWLAQARSRRGKSDQAVELARAAIRWEPTAAWAHGELGSMLLSKGDVAEAELAFRTAAEMDPRGVSFRSMLGETLLRQGRREEALAVLRALTGAGTADPHAHARLGHALLQSGDLAEAEQAFRTAAEMDPKIAGFRSMLAEVLSRQRRHGEALAVLRVLTAEGTSDPHTHSRLGHVLLQSGDLAGAEQGFRAAAALDPKGAGFRSMLAEVLLRQGRHEEALAVLRALTAGGTSDPQTHSRLGHVLLRSGDLVEAERAFRTAAEMDPKIAGFRSMLAEVLLRQGRREESLAVLRALTVEGTLDPHTYARLGHVLLQSGDLVEAERAFRTAAEMDPKSDGFRNMVAEVLSRQERHDEALAILRALTAEGTSDAHIHARFGHALLRSGDLTGAEQAFRIAAEMDPKVDGFRRMLAEVLSRQGRGEEALAVSAVP